MSMLSKMKFVSAEPERPLMPLKKLMRLLLFGDDPLFFSTPDVPDVPTLYIL